MSDGMAPGAEIVVVGIGADGWAGLHPRARRALREAREVIGSPRQLGLLPDGVAPRRPWPSPLAPAVTELVHAPASAGPIAVLASGDPMLHGIGATLARRIPAARLVVLAHLSAFALACSRLAWPGDEVTLVSAVVGPVGDVVAWLQPGRRLVVYLTGVDGAARLARVLDERGYGSSRFVVMEQLDGENERIVEATARDWGAREADPLHLACVECTAEPDTPVLSRAPGLPDDAYDADDGQLTKRHLRALAISELAPAPGMLLWDIGAGAGSVATEWLRAEPTAEVVAIERDAGRAARAADNARRLGAGRVRIVGGEAPAVLDALGPAPDRIFIGGGVSAPAMVATAWARLAPGGRLVAHAVTLESERALTDAHERLGGTLTRIEIAHATPIGRFTGWRPQMPVTQWRVDKPR